MNRGSVIKILILSLILISFSVLKAENIISPQDSLNNIEDFSAFSLNNSQINKFPFKNQNNINRFFPGVVSYFQDFYIRGSRSYETGFFIDGFKFNDPFTGQNSFFINPNAFEKIDFYNGFIPVNFSNVSAGLFDYQIKTGGEKLHFNAEHLTDNITFTRDPFSGNKRLGTYYYGHNETNLSLGGPLYFNHIRFFINANYLFQRDKNPQRYPGANNLIFNDPLSLNSVTINLPEGIVPFNHFESYNLVSTLLFDFNNIKVKVSGIYFNENHFTERHHILDYLNSRNGIIDKKGGIINIKLDHKINDLISYSINGNYFTINDVTKDQYLGDNIWTFGDSVANAQAGAVWERKPGEYGRYFVPRMINIFGHAFTPANYPADHRKSFQENINLKGNINFFFENYKLKLGGEFSQSLVRYWNVNSQTSLAAFFDQMRRASEFTNLSDNELKEYILINRGVNNFGYDPLGKKIDNGLSAPPKPSFYSFYTDNQLKYFDFFLSAGFKLDVFNSGYKKMIDPAQPEKTFERNSGNIIQDGLIDSDNSTFFSPKISLKYSGIEKALITFNFSKNIQSQSYHYMYEGFNSLNFQLRNSSFSSVTLNNLHPIVSTLYDIILSYSPLKDFNTELTFYIKEEDNLIGINSIQTNLSSPFQGYVYIDDNVKADINGFELLLNYTSRSINLLSSVSYQNSREGSNILLGELRVSGLQDNRVTTSVHNNKLNFKALFDYDFSDLQSTSGVFQNLNFVLLFSFNSGHPYTRIYRETNSTILATETTPNVSQIDVKIEKGFTIYRDIELNLFLYVINLFDSKNIYNVFSNTGSAQNDDNLYEQLINVYGEQIVQLNNLINSYNPMDEQQNFYGPARQFGFGVRINY